MTILSQELNFDEFGNEFQINLIHSLYNDKNFFIQINDILEEEYFTYEVCKEMFKIFKDFYKKYKCLPAFDDIKIIINENKNEMMRTLLYRELSNFEKINKSRNFSFINERALEFCKRQKIKKSILTCNELANEENSDEKIRKILNDALNAGQSKDIGHEYIESLYSRYNINKRKPVTTNWPYLNKVLKGGLSAGELLLIIGSVGKGKCTEYNTKIDIEYDKYEIEHNGKIFNLVEFDKINTRRGIIFVKDLLETDEIISI